MLLREIMLNIRDGKETYEAECQIEFESDNDGEPYIYGIFDVSTRSEIEKRNVVESEEKIIEHFFEN